MSISICRVPSYSNNLIFYNLIYFLTLYRLRGIMNLSSDRSCMARRKSNTQIGATTQFSFLKLNWDLSLTS